MHRQEGIALSSPPGEERETICSGSNYKQPDKRMSSFPLETTSPST